MVALPSLAGLPRGTRVELIETRGYERFGLAVGQHGTVELTDSLGTVHIRWDHGPRIGITADVRELIRPASDLQPLDDARRPPAHLAMSNRHDVTPGDSA